MLSFLRCAVRPLARLGACVALLAALLAGAACVPTGPVGGVPGNGGAVQVALLVPGGSGQATDELLARSLQNAARLAISDLGGAARIDLRVYNTAGNPAQAQAMALQAVGEGAEVILGPLYAQEANAVGVAVAGQGINVLSFSNNAAIAGGNVFVLGQTFDSTAAQLARYAVRQGLGRIQVVHERTTAGEAGRAAIQAGVQRAGGTVAGVSGYEFSQNGIVAAVPGIVAATRANGAQAIFLTADTAGALPLVTQLLSENGINPAATRFIGLTRWDIPPATLALPGVQGGLFALPDPGLYAQFTGRYQASFGEAPMPIAGLAYDGIAAIGALARNGRGISAAALTQGAGFAGVGGVFRFLPNGANERGLAIAQVRDSQVVVIDPAPRSFGGAGL